MKVVLLCLIITCCTYVGFGLASYYRRRVKFFGDCISFANKMVVEINFKKNKLMQILTDFKTQCGTDFKSCLKSFEAYLLSGSNMEENLFFKKNICLNSEEKNLIFCFFKSLGRYDVENQIKEVEGFKKSFETMLFDAQAENKKYGTLYVKLGLMAGLLIAIILF